MRRPQTHPLHAHDLTRPVGTHHLDSAEEAIRLFDDPHFVRLEGAMIADASSNSSALLWGSYVMPIRRAPAAANWSPRSGASTSTSTASGDPSFRNRLVNASK